MKVEHLRLFLDLCLGIVQIQLDNYRMNECFFAMKSELRAQAQTQLLGAVSEPTR